ncbi:hypothetical protein ACIQGT_39920 [Streptomyces sp. NPDC093108]|uniref:hypothetical protein n=1 Tax=Streptomyces sp. NPDC093108 TaxID=3366030 RepID=UPI00380C8076
MNWADLLEALLVAGFVLPLLLAVFRLIPFTACLLIQTTAFTVMTGWSFLRGNAEDTVWYASLTLFYLLMLRRDHRRSKGRRHDQDRARATDRAPGPDRTASKDHDRSTD